MKALVLAGGHGTRLRPFSHTIPKQLVPVANAPVLFHVLDALRAAGVTETGIIVSAPGEAVRAAVGDGSRFGMSVTYLPQDEPLGLAHCVLIARDFLADDDFVMYLADNVFADGIGEPLLEFQERRPAAQLVVAKAAEPTECGIAEVDDTGRVLGVEEKPDRPRSDLAVTGVYFFSAQIHEAVRAIKPSARGELEITDAVQWLVSQGRDVQARLLAGPWHDTGTVDGLLDCNRTLLERLRPEVRGAVTAGTVITGPVVVAEDALIERSVITGPALLGPGCVVRGSRIGPGTSLGAGCLLEDADVRHSMLLDGAHVTGVGPIAGSVIGRNALVGPPPGAPDGGPAAHRLVVGDDGRIEVAGRTEGPGGGPQKGEGGDA
ncbi:glucose-1-phosphate thymidylyltransferase [Actinomadura chibensis]|uniref:Glucose-1-phosphate thymidylyltransferase n=1 Tax=Actinomadura chibensis TaxID=392828 RepID=A0A5D0NLS0_9ACTN|nr:glucose-1-phosphate thymidylyltransferase [Actinomadura chibensis]TYB45402.1 glucose-1-phosphate thymidylyltransferase [Actinomadura chibensis]